MSYILNDDINIIIVYNVCLKKCRKWNDNKRPLCDTLRQKQMCLKIITQITELENTKKNYVNVMDDCEPPSKLLFRKNL